MCHLALIRLINLDYLWSMDHLTQRSYYFHSQLLVPEGVAIEARGHVDELARDEVLMIWQEAHGGHHHFKEKDKCYHIDNLWQMMRVDKIVRIKTPGINGEVIKSRIQSIRCHWMQRVTPEYE